MTGYQHRCAMLLRKVDTHFPLLLIRALPAALGDRQSSSQHCINVMALCLINCCHMDRYAMTSSCPGLKTQRFAGCVDDATYFAAEAGAVHVSMRIAMDCVSVIRKQHVTQATTPDGMHGYVRSDPPQLKRVRSNEVAS